jgi:hypothetical protein
VIPFSHLVIFCVCVFILAIRVFYSNCSTMLENEMIIVENVNGMG